MADIIADLFGIELIKTLLIGLIAIIIQKSFSSTDAYVRNTIFSHQKYTISGIWLSKFDSCEQKKHNYELVKIVQNQEIVKLYIDQYSSYSEKVLKLRGSGIFRGSKLSSIYYSSNKSDALSGVLILRSVYSPIKPACLIGKYGEFGSEKYEEIPYDGDYMLTKINLPIVKYIKMKLHMQCFRNYEDINKYYTAFYEVTEVKE